MKIKRGMSGSRCGKSRREPTEVLKAMSKKARRREGIEDTSEQDMPTITGKVSWKTYKCEGCGQESNHSTNHYGEIYCQCEGCSCKVLVCQEPLPEGWGTPEPWKMVNLGDVLDTSE